MTQLGRDTDLPQEPIGAEGSREVGAQHLDRDATVVLEIPCAVDGGHSTFTELPLDLVLLGESGPQLVERVVHGILSGFSVVRWLVTSWERTPVDLVAPTRAAPGGGTLHWIERPPQRNISFAADFAPARALTTVAGAACHPIAHIRETKCLETGRGCMGPRVG